MHGMPCELDPAIHGSPPEAVWPCINNDTVRHGEM
jgi:hypothetical protein